VVDEVHGTKSLRQRARGLRKTDQVEGVSG
jgi:hypothetical protein